jgi:hypothetical protein
VGSWGWRMCWRRLRRKRDKCYGIMDIRRKYHVFVLDFGLVQRSVFAEEVHHVVVVDTLWFDFCSLLALSIFLSICKNKSSILSTSPCSSLQPFNCFSSLNIFCRLVICISVLFVFSKVTGIFVKFLISFKGSS